MRGSPHAHMLVWVSPHLKLTEQTVPIFIEYIDKIVSSDIPEEKMSAELVQKYQTNSHTKTFNKRNTFCRLNFPKISTAETIISVPLPPELLQNERETQLEKRDEILGKVMEEMLKLKTENEMNVSTEKLLSDAQFDMKGYYWAMRVAPDVFFQIHFRGTVCTINVNSYNLHLLQCFQSNMDLSHVLDAYVLVSYLMSYFSKKETAVSEAMTSAVKQRRSVNSDYKQTLRKLAVAFLTSREV